MSQAAARQSPGRPPIAAVVLDMDGLLIDTEPVWRAVEARVYGELGLVLTEADMASTMGVRVEDVAAHWRRFKPWPGAGAEQPSDAAIAGRIVDAVVAQVVTSGAPRPGACEAVSMLRRLGLPIAIASSSPGRLIDTVCTRIGIDIGIRCSATDEARGKPAPDVYLTAARRLGVDPDRCLAVEDSPAGVRSALAAGMRCIAVPDPLVGDDPGFTAADLRLGALLDLDEAVMRSLGWDG